MIGQADPKGQIKNGVLLYVIGQGESTHKGLGGPQMKYLIQRFNKTASLQLTNGQVSGSHLFLQFIVTPQHTGQALLQMLVADLWIELFDRFLAQSIATVGQENHNGLQKRNGLSSVVNLDHDLPTYGAQSIKDEVVGYVVWLPGVQDNTVKVLGQPASNWITNFNRILAPLRDIPRFSSATFRCACPWPWASSHQRRIS